MCNHYHSLFLLIFQSINDVDSAFEGSNEVSFSVENASNVRIYHCDSIL